MEPSEFGEWGKDHNIGIAKTFCELCVCLKGSVEGEQAVPRGQAVLFSLKDFQFPLSEAWMNKAEKGTPRLFTPLWLQHNFVALPDQLNQPFKALSTS